jgi:hypothetical protein
MNLLITGGAGFIGSNLIQHVIDDVRVLKLVNLDCLTYAGHLANLETVSRHPKYVFEQVDLRDKGATLKVVERHAITHVMHLAAESHVDRSITGPGDFIATNITGSGAPVWRIKNSTTFRPMKFTAPWVPPAISLRPRRMRRTRPIRPAKPRVTCSCALIITPTGCPRSSQIVPTTTVRSNSPRN